ncbi:integration host factor subunit beta [Candidatus Sumerlaeota bacterium]|nr:integration host factor subunit beta [Candidatus Sumerlaeota bacterium]
MIKLDIAHKIAESLHIKDKEAMKIVTEIITAIRETVVKYGRLEIRNFGVFQIKERKSKIGRNPKTKVEYPIPRRRVVTFKPGKDIRTV